MYVKPFIQLIATPLVIAAFVFGSKYSSLLFYWDSETVDSKLNYEFGERLRESGITSIDGIKSMFFHKVLIDYRIDGKEYQAEVDYKYYQEAPDALISIRNGTIHYRGSTPQLFKGNNQEYSYHFTNAEYLVHESILAVAEAEQRRLAWSQ